MDSSESSSFGSFKSKKILHFSSKPSPSPTDLPAKALDQSPWSSETPEKPLNPPRRLRNRGTALSLKEVRQFAKTLQVQDPSYRSDPLMSSPKQKISSPRNQTPFIKPKRSDSFIKLPEKYEILDKFFSSLDSSIRLLRIKGTMSTFTNISPKIECLTDRRFSYGHLAQLKFILPEAIEVEKVLIRDERTGCMKPDLHVTLNVSAIENDANLKSNGGNLLLRKVFRARLLDFSKAYPEGDEVPEETLPEPFNQSKKEFLHRNTVRASNFSLTNEQSALSVLQPAAASHLSQSFRRGFSKKVSSNEAVSTSQMPSVMPVQRSDLPVSEPHFDQSDSVKEASSKSIISHKDLLSSDFQACPPSSFPPATPVKKLDSTKNEFSTIASSSVQGTPAKSLSTPAKLMSATPALRPPKRGYTSPDDDSTRSPNKLVRRPQRSRSLKFDTPVKNKHAEELSESKNLLLDSDIFDLLPDNLLQSIREKEKKASEDQDPAISQAKRRQQIIASLPKLFDMLHFLFQSIKRSTITKDELMHKIIASHLDIVDKREVEEQLTLLQELVPEWIYEKSASTGDLLLCINKISSPESLRARLAVAKMKET